MVCFVLEASGATGMVMAYSFPARTESASTIIAINTVLF
jgi:hypothetical protein